MNAISENTTFRCASGHLYGTYRVHSITGDKVLFSNEQDFLEVHELSARYLQEKQREGKLMVLDGNP